MCRSNHGHFCLPTQCLVGAFSPNSIRCSIQTSEFLLLGGDMPRCSLAGQLASRKADFRASCMYYYKLEVCKRTIHVHIFTIFLMHYTIFELIKYTPPTYLKRSTGNFFSEATFSSSRYSDFWSPFRTISIKSL